MTKKAHYDKKNLRHERVFELRTKARESVLKIHKEVDEKYDKLKRGEV